MYNSNTETDLLIRVAAGDEVAFEQLVSRYSEKVFFHALTFVKTWGQAEEIVQDVFLKIWQKREKLTEVNDWDNYLFVVSKNHLISALRKKIRHIEPFRPNQVHDLLQTSASYTEYENMELGTLLERAINQLPEQKKAVFRMIHQEGLTQEEVGRKLGIAERTVRWNLVSAINGIKDFLHRYGPEELYLLFVLLFEFTSSN